MRNAVGWGGKKSRYWTDPQILRVFKHFGHIGKYIFRYGCFLKWWCPQNTPKWSFLVGKCMVVGYHHFRKHPYTATTRCILTLFFSQTDTKNWTFWTPFTGKNWYWRHPNLQAFYTWGSMNTEDVLLAFAPRLFWKEDRSWCVYWFMKSFPNNWVGFHPPTKPLNNQCFFHCSVEFFCRFPQLHDVLCFNRLLKFRSISRWLHSTRRRDRHVDEWKSKRTVAFYGWVWMTTLFEGGEGCS